jgi:hypothetical protein
MAGSQGDPEDPEDPTAQGRLGMPAIYVSETHKRTMTRLGSKVALGTQEIYGDVTGIGKCPILGLYWTSPLNGNYR